MSSISADFFDSVGQLQLQDFPSELLESILKSEVSETVKDEILASLPETPSLVHLLQEVTNSGRKLIDSIEEKVDFWEEALQRGFDVRRLIAIFTVLIEDCQQHRNADKVNLQLGFLGAQCYLLVCCIPGSSARNIFNSTLYERCIDLFRMGIKLQRGLSKEKPAGGGKGKKKGRGRRSSDLPLSNDDGEEETESESPNIDRNAVKNVQKYSCNLLKSLWKFLGCYSLKGYNEVLHHTAQLLCDVLMMDVFNASDTTDATTYEDLQGRNVSELAFANLHRLCDTRHGRIKDISLNVFKCIFPLLKSDNWPAQWKDTSNSTGINVAQYQLHVRELTLVFIAGIKKSCLDEADRIHIAKSVVVLIQHLCDKVVDRAENRRFSALTVVRLLLQLPSECFIWAFKWILSYSKSSKVLFRSFGIEVQSSLLAKLCDGEDITLKPNILCDVKLKIIGCIISRCSDKTASIRAKAIVMFSQLLSGDNGEIRQFMMHFCTPQVVRRVAMARTPQDSNRQSLTDPSEQPSDLFTPIEDGNNQQKHPFDFEALRVSVGESISVMDADGFTSLLLRRCNDEKIPVRKAAIAAFESLLRFLPEKIGQPVNVDIFALRSADVAVSVRRQALDSLTSLLLSYPDLMNLREIWCDSVMPLVVDRETSVAERAMEVFNDVVVSRLDVIDDKLPWAIVARMERLRDSCRYLQRIFQHLKKSGKLPKRIVDTLYRVMKDCPAYKQMCWMLLAELSAVVDVRATQALDIWDSNNKDETSLQYLSRIVSQLPKGKLSEETVESLASELSEKLARLQYSLDSLSSAVFLLSKLWGSDSDRCSNWCEKTVENLDDQLHTSVFCGSHEEISEEKFVRCAFTIGEIIQLRPKISSQRIYLCLESVISDSQTRSSAKIRGIAALTLGKICLQDEDVAKKTVGIFAQVLNTTDSWLVRNNIIIVMSDLCMRFTSIVDRYIGFIANCLKDPSTLVRKQTLSLLTNLLKEDYLKWRGILFIQFLSGLLDGHPEIRKFTEFCLVNVLLQRHPGIFFNHFVESIFQLNRIAHGGFNKVSIEDSTGQFSLSGVDNRTARMRLYTFMLAQLSPVQKFQVSCKLSVEILGAVVDEKLPAEPELLLDVLKILISKEIKFIAQFHGDGDEEDQEEIGERNVAVDALKKAITQGMRQNTVENVIPIVIALKHLFEKQRSPLLRYVMLYLKDLLKDFKNEIGEILAADRELAAELEFDMKKFDANVSQEEQNIMRTPKPLANPIVAPVSRKRPFAEVQGSDTVECVLPIASTPFQFPNLPENFQLRTTNMCLSPITAGSALKRRLV